MGNLKLPKAKQSPDVMQKKDTMAKNVSNHMEQGKNDMPKQKEIKTTGQKSQLGKGKAPRY